MFFRGVWLKASCINANVLHAFFGGDRSGPECVARTARFFGILRLRGKAGRSAGRGGGSNTGSKVENWHNSCVFRGIGLEEGLLFILHLGIIFRESELPITFNRSAFGIGSQLLAKIVFDRGQTELYIISLTKIWLGDKGRPRQPLKGLFIFVIYGQLLEISSFLVF